MRRYTKRNKNGEKLNFWLSYSDMMAALLGLYSDSVLHPAGNPRNL